MVEGIITPHSINLKDYINNGTDEWRLSRFNQENSKYDELYLDQKGEVVKSQLVHPCIFQHLCNLDLHIIFVEHI